MRPRGSVWLSARKPPDITGVAPHFAEDSDPRGTASAAPAPGGGGPLGGGGGWGTHCEIDLCAVAVLPVAVRRCGCVARGESARDTSEDQGNRTDFLLKVSRCVCQSAPVRALVVPVCCERGLYFEM